MRQGWVFAGGGAGRSGAVLSEVGIHRVPVRTSTSASSAGMSTSVAGMSTLGDGVKYEHIGYEQ